MEFLLQSNSLVPQESLPTGRQASGFLLLFTEAFQKTEKTGFQLQACPREFLEEKFEKLQKINFSSLTQKKKPR